jgi:hypothetical protein
MLRRNDPVPAPRTPGVQIYTWSPAERVPRRYHPPSVPAPLSVENLQFRVEHFERSRVAIEYVGRRSHVDAGSDLLVVTRLGRRNGG